MVVWATGLKTQIFTKSGTSQSKWMFQNYNMHQYGTNEVHYQDWILLTMPVSCYFCTQTTHFSFAKWVHHTSWQDAGILNIINFRKVWPLQMFTYSNLSGVKRLMKFLGCKLAMLFLIDHLATTVPVSCVVQSLSSLLTCMHIIDHDSLFS